MRAWLCLLLASAATLARADAPQLVVLVSCDTMRADRLSVYGYGKDTTPNLREFSKDAVVFENAFTPEPWTPSAHMSMLTGLYPRNHGLTANINIPDTVRTLPEVLKDAGYATAGHAGMQWWFLPWRGFGRGFDEYSVPDGQRDVFETCRLGLKFLEAHPNARTFLFLHTYDLHSHMEGTLPYGTADAKYQRFSTALGAPPALTREGPPLQSPTAFLGAHNQGNLKITPEESAYMQALYDDALLRVDDALGQFFARLREQGRYDNALIIITADHGEAFGEHDRYMHGDIYEANVRVPLLVKFPRGAHAGTRAPGMARLIDLFPTIIEAAGIADAPKVDGHSLAPLLASASTAPDNIYLKRGRWRGLRGAQFKYIEERGLAQRQFFDLRADPLETVDLFPASPPEMMLYMEQARSFFLPAPGGWHVAVRAGTSPWQARFRASADQRLAAVALETGAFEERNDEVSEARHVEGTLELKPGASDVLHILPADPTVPVTLSLRSETPFSALAPGAAPQPAREVTLTLNPAAPAVTMEPPAGPNADTPELRVWFVPTTAANVAKPLSAEAQEELESLGYLDAKP